MVSPYYSRYALYVILRARDLLLGGSNFLWGGNWTNHTNITITDIEGFTFKGMGWCVDENETYYSQTTSFEIMNAEDCAMWCHSKDPAFAGFDFLFKGGKDSSPYTSCNCLMMGGSEDKYNANTTIAGADGLGEELCYSWDEARNLSVAPPSTEPPFVKGYEFKGMGQCANRTGFTYSDRNLPGINSVGGCARTCEEKYRGWDGFVGFGLRQDEFGGLCTCWTTKIDFPDYAIGPITGVLDNWRTDEFCYARHGADQSELILGA